jgi:hypothetical protein
MLPLTTTFLDGDAMRPFDFVVTEGLVSAGLDGTEHQRVHPHTAPPGMHMDAHQFVAELVFDGRKPHRTRGGEGRGEGTTGATIAVAHVRGVAGVPERSKKSDWSLTTAPAINAELVETVDAIVLRVAEEASSPYGATTGPLAVVVPEPGVSWIHLPSQRYRGPGQRSRRLPKQAPTRLWDYPSC